MATTSPPRLSPSGTAPMPSKAPGLLFGLGLGGFVDGIVLHQILQWHHMVSDVADFPMTTVAGLEVNTLADGFFHVGTWVLVLAASLLTLVSWRRGAAATWRRAGPSTSGCCSRAGASSTWSRAW